MAELMKLYKSPTTVEFSPLRELDVPEDLNRVINKSLSGIIYEHIWSDKETYEVPISKISKADAEQINTWWRNGDQISFYYDLENFPSGNFNARIVNEDRPMQMMYETGWATYYYGTLLIRESD